MVQAGIVKEWRVNMALIRYTFDHSEQLHRHLISWFILSPGTKHFTQTILQSTEDLKIDYKWQVVAEQSVAVLKAAKQ